MSPIFIYLMFHLPMGFFAICAMWALCRLEKDCPWEPPSFKDSFKECWFMMVMGPIAFIGPAIGFTCLASDGALDWGKLLRTPKLSIKMPSELDKMLEAASLAQVGSKPDFLAIKPDRRSLVVPEWFLIRVQGAASRISGEKCPYKPDGKNDINNPHTHWWFGYNHPTQYLQREFWTHSSIG